MKTSPRSKKIDSAFPQFTDDFAYPPLPEVPDYMATNYSNTRPVIGYLLVGVVVLLSVVGLAAIG